MKNKFKLIKFIIRGLLAFFEVFAEYFVEEAGSSDGDTAEKEEEYQLCYFPMNTLRITQNENIGTHKGSLAMDFAGADTTKEWCFAPCDLKVIRIRTEPENCGEIYFESLKPVKFADGTVDYLHLLMLHDDNSCNLVANQTIKQNEKFYREGGKYKGNPNHYAAHIHVEAGKGKWNTAYQFANEHGVYVIENQQHLYNLFWLKKGTQNYNDIEHKFKYEV